jgi:hypothetical protein
MRLITVLFVLFLAACTIPASSLPQIELVFRPPPEPTCAEQARRAVALADEADQLRRVVDDVRRWNYLADWRVVDAGKCKVLVLRRSHLLFPDGSLYDYHNLERPLATDVGTKAMMSRVYACRLAQLEALGGRKPSGADEMAADCSDPK